MKKLNKYQKPILVTGFVIFLLMNLFPPWVAWLHPPGYTESVSIGYGLIISPPGSKYGYDSYVSINYGRLLLQWIIIAVATGGTLIIARGKK